MHNFNIEDIFSISNEEDFSKLAMEIFYHQAENNKVYKEYLSYLKIKIADVKEIHQIPFLPIDFFKSHQVVSSEESEEEVFYSSGTTGMERSKHYVIDRSIYDRSFLKAFTLFYPNWREYSILGLLPNYHDNKNSSLIYMVQKLMDESNQKENGFYLGNLEELIITINNLEVRNQKYFLFGVSYALLDLAEKYNVRIDNGVIIETGGMKGRRKEITRQELHNQLKTAFRTQSIHSEYGMTELLSQAYSKDEGKYFAPPWMKIVIRDTYDPFDYLDSMRSGGINIIDLANYHSCSFLETKDLGKINADGSFEVLGRFDNSDIRGCNLLVAE